MKRQACSIRVLLSLAIAIGFVTNRAQAQPDPNYILDFDMPDVVDGVPGSIVTFEAKVRLVAAALPVQAWGLSFVNSDSLECKILSATVMGTAGASVNDSPPGFRTDLEDITSLTANGGGVVSAVILSNDLSVTLDPAGVPYDLLRVTLQARIPPSGEFGSVQSGVSR